MESKKRWHFWLIIAVLFLTIYNVLPTVFFYTKPLHSPIDKNESNQIATSIATRVNGLEKSSSDWIYSFCHLLNIKSLNVKIEETSPEYATVSFSKEADADKFRRFLPRAGSLITFAPAQLSLAPSDPKAGSSVIVHRRIPIHFEENKIHDIYQFTETTDDKGNFTPLYKALVDDRILELASAIAGTSENAKLANAILAHPQDPQIQELAIVLGQRMIEVASLFGDDSAISARFYASLSQSNILDKDRFAANLLSSISAIKDKIRIEKITLQKSSSLDPLQTQRLDLLSSKEACLTEFEGLLRKYGSLFQKSKSAWDHQAISSELDRNPKELVFNGRNPVFERLVIDSANGKLLLKLHPDLMNFRDSLDKKNASHYLKDQVDQVIYNQVALVARASSEKLSPSQGNFTISLQDLSDSKSLLVMRLSPIAKKALVSLHNQIERGWHPTHLDLKNDSFPVWDYETYVSLPISEKNFGLLLYSPVASNQSPPEGMRMNSIYVIARGMDRMIANLQANPESESAKQFLKDFESLRILLQQQGFYGYSGKSAYISPEFRGDFIFEKEDYYTDILKATRENFTVKGTKRFATLEFSNLEQRILAENAIDDKIHEDLLKWRDDYHAASLGIKGLHPYDIPKPTQNVFWSNFKLSTKKFFRGDDRKILKWGLDLSGGKTVQIELRDVGNRLVTSDADIRQGIEELYSRVNKMGVSEVNIRQEGHTISLDFPGSQAFSAAELVKASTMFFHVVNEKFSQNNTALAGNVEQFLQDVWNEAVITGRKTPEDINAIAWRHIHGDSLDPEAIQPRSSSARILHEQGLRLANPQDVAASSYLDDSTTKIALLRGNDYTDWNGHSHPLVFVFNNFALEGSNLDNVMASYDPSKGNFINFEVKSSPSKSTLSNTNPRDDFEAWTTKYCKETIAGSSLANFSRGEGWRMAVILNGSIISAPTLGSPLRTSASITGSFTQRELGQLEADLKAGSLSFTPKILSEKNVSPELGSHERHLGILGMFLALGLVVCSMVSYYRFSGIVASVAVLFNLIIMWAALQMIQATMTLASIAGIILTLGMAVDANVLVFERIKEEFSSSGKIASAVHAGYRKAFSAIFDSNITTLIAALILLNFDSGPIKGLAITLIIGLISSMFTALFMTRYFFARWVQNPANKELKMANLFKVKNFNFLKFTKPTIIFSLAVILIGGFVAIAKKQTFLGMDFTGGYVLSFEVHKTPEENYRQQIEHALISNGVSPQDFLVRELSPNNNLRLFLSSSMEQQGHPFYGLPLEYDDKDPDYTFETNPRIVWVVNALAKAGVSMTPDSLLSLDQSWSSISGQMSDTMRNHAIIGLCVALLCILVYITIRFEFTYAASATICLLHDIIFTLGVMALLHWIGVPVQIDLHTVAALLTIVGYSLNDTIIIFDRIREDMRLMHKQPVINIINHALNATLSRTLMTSGTTLLVLVPLIALGGSTIFSFALVMGIGVIFGTLSSLFIAAPLMLYFYRREVEKRKVHSAAT
jgi:SecD/SecF fusion protein